MSRARSRSGLVVLLALLASTASARPADTTPDVIYRAANLEQDLDNAIMRSLATGVTQQNPGVAPARPWDDLDGFCATPQRQRFEAVGRFFLEHVGTTAPAGAGNRNAMARAAAAAQMGGINDGIQRELNRASSTFPPDLQARFMTPGVRFGARPRTWGEAAAQRAEWSVVLHAVGESARRGSTTTTGFDANYAAVVWSVLECDLLAGHDRFIAALDAAGETITEPRQVAAVEHLRRFVAP